MHSSFRPEGSRDIFFSNSGRRRTRTSSRSSRGQTWGKQRDNPTGTRQANPSGQGKSERHPEGCKTFAERFPRHFIIRRKFVRRLRQRVSSFKAELQHRAFEQPPKAQATGRSNLPPTAPYPAPYPVQNDNIRLDFRSRLPERSTPTSPGHPTLHQVGPARARAPPAKRAGGASGARGEATVEQAGGPG